MNDSHDKNLIRWAREGRTGSPPVAAATVVLLRDGQNGLETLMLRRHSKIAFGGMWVFPGGRVDEADCQEPDAQDELGAARCAAIRETKEETGLELAPTDLVPLAHWTPPAITPRRFLTWFFLAPAPVGEVQIDDGEIQEYAWMSPEEAFSKRHIGQIELAPPTFVTLHTLALCNGVAEALESASQKPPEYFKTAIAVGHNGPVALWHGDCGYESKDVNADGLRHRLSMAKEEWRYERS